ncbi:MAG: DUF5106 domain-containing protein [Flavobacteriales bacterium]|nr:DUF5106 domain-containing protein [Flavobacteriales bacterium]
MARSYFYCFSLFFSILISSITVQGQSYKISLKLDALTDSTIYLANYFGSKLYYADTTVVSKKGVALFEGDEELKAGKYAFVLPGPKLYEVLVDDDPFFEMQADTSNFIATMEVKGSDCNQLYYDYIKFINVKKTEVTELNEKLKLASEDSTKAESIKEKIIKINEQVSARQKSLLKDNPDNWGAQVIGMTMPIDIPEPPKDENGVVTDSLFQYRYYINHFFDNVPLDNPAIARTPEFDKKFKDFFNNALLQSPDTVSRYADEFIRKVEYDEELFKFVVHYLTYSFETSKIMGMDAAFVHMIENYYMKDKTPWMDSTSLANVTERALRMKPTLLGNKAPYMRLHDTTGTKFTSLYDVEADYTVVYIWDPDCGHCKKENPKMVEMYDKFEDKGVKVYSVGNPHENEEWIKYLREHPEMGKLINVSDSPKHPDYFRTYYDVHSTPVILLLDKEKKIIAKKVGVDQLEQIIERELTKNRS